MKILVINSDCLTRNSSANLCHLAYLQGLINCGHQVYLLSAYNREYVIDNSMIIPGEVISYQYSSTSFYEKLSLKKQNNVAVKISDDSDAHNISNRSIKTILVNNAKKVFLSLYGPHGIYFTFVKKAKKFVSDVKFDFVISLSTPPSSHLLAYKLINKGNVKTQKWIQIWEDPWYSDAYGFNGKKKIYREEKRLLSFADKVCYVSPLTLANQKRLFPKSADKMYWQPLPYYYKNDENTQKHFNNIYGYFGSYVPVARNLEPFYKAAKNTDIEVNICGDSGTLFNKTSKIHMYPRLPLDKLKPIEDGTDVLVFLCNRKGGQIPGKIYQYSATYKTILFILDGTDEEKKVLRDFFEPFNRYVFCENTEEDITRAINLIESGDLGNISNRPLEEFNPKITIQNILDGKIL